MEENKVMISLSSYNVLRDSKIKLDMLINALFKDARLSTTNDHLWLNISESIVETILPENYRATLNELIRKKENEVKNNENAKG